MVNNGQMNKHSRTDTLTKRYSDTDKQTTKDTVRERLKTDAYIGLLAYRTAETNCRQRRRDEQREK